MGSLPFRYLGVVLTLRKVKFVECRPLIVQITKPITHWVTRFLSYGARVCLIRSVLDGINLNRNRLKFSYYP